MNINKFTQNSMQAVQNCEKIAYDYAQGTNDVLWDRHSNNGAPGGVMQRIVNRNDQGYKRQSCVLFHTKD